MASIQSNRSKVSAYDGCLELVGQSRNLDKVTENGSHLQDTTPT